MNTIVVTSTKQNIKFGYEGEDNVTKIVFPYDESWLEYGEGNFEVRILRCGDEVAYTATDVVDDRQAMTLTMTVTDIELSVRGRGEMQLCYVCPDSIKKSPIYQYTVNRSVDYKYAVDPPDGSIIASVEKSLSEIKNTTNRLSNSVISIESSIDDVNSQIDNINDKISEFDEEIDSIGDVETRVDNLETSIQSISGRINTAEGNINENAESISDLNESVTELENRKVTDLETSGGKSDSGKYLTVGTDGKVKATSLTIPTITVDGSLSTTSENPVQNKVIKTELNNINSNIETCSTEISKINGSLENHFHETSLSGWSYFVGAAGSAKIIIDNNLITAYKRCNSNTIYTVRKIATSRFRIFFTSVVPVEGESIIDGDVVSDDSATSITVTSPDSAQYICVYLWHKLLDTTLTKEEVLASLELNITGTVDADVRLSLGTIATKANMVTGGEIAIPWQRGGLSVTGDAQENSRNRVRSDFITGNKLSVKITSNLIEYSLRYYNDAGECIGSDSAFRTVDADDVFSNYEGTSAIRILARLAANSNITNENFSTITENLKVIDTGIREQIKNLDGGIPTVKSYYTSEIADTTRKVIDLQTEPCVTFALVTDIHYKSIDGGAEGECLNELLFKDTALNMKAVADGCKIDFVFCNGDFTDGDIEKSALKGRVKEMMDLFRTINRPFLCSVGNHDDNRYSSPVSLMDSTEIFANYVAQISKSDVVYGSMNGTNYYFDFANLGIRFIVINSNTFTGAYGYTEDTRQFTSDALASMPEGYQGFLFVHTSPATVMNYNQTVRPNGADLETIIKNSGRMCAMFYGHSHQDNSFGPSGSGALNIYDYLAICTCCGKCTNTNGDASKWSPNATMPTRTLGTYTEDLWDVVVIRPLSRKINFVRFGAGVDREFTY